MEAGFTSFPAFLLSQPHGHRQSAASNGRLKIRIKSALLRRVREENMITICWMLCSLAYATAYTDADAICVTEEIYAEIEADLAEVVVGRVRHEFKVVDMIPTSTTTEDGRTLHLYLGGLYGFEDAERRNQSVRIYEDGILITVKLVVPTLKYLAPAVYREGRMPRPFFLDVRIPNFALNVSFVLSRDNITSMRIQNEHLEGLLYSADFEGFSQQSAEDVKESVRNVLCKQLSAYVYPIMKGFLEDSDTYVVLEHTWEEWVAWLQQRCTHDGER